jgi:hypothetical protein
MAGKGDKWRKTNFKNYFENWEKVKVKNDKKDDGFVKLKNKLVKKY